MALEQRAASLSDNFSFNRIQSWLITFVVFLNLSALYQEFAPWFYLLAFICFSWRINTLVTTVNKPNKKGTKFLQSGLAIAGCLLLAVNAPTLGLLASMIHLLSFSYLMKMLEQNKPKDFFQLFCLGLFVLASSLIFDQGLALFSFFALTFILNLTVLLHYYCARFTLAQSYKKSAIMVLQSVPLAVCLFLFFPKLSPLWQMPSTQSAKTGLSDNVSVGDIADLALSNELAFRVNFTENPPDYAQLYWRALTLANFDGKTWTKYSNSTMAQYRQLVNNKPANNKPANDEPVKAQHKPLNENASPGVAPLVNNVSATRYQVITEPSFQHWLFALGVSKVNTSGITIKKDQTLYSQKPINKVMTYQASSFLNEKIELNLSRADKQLNLDLPPGSNPRLAAEAKRLRAKSANNQEYITLVLQQFYQQSFHYTLKPPQLTGEVLDQFYFDSKQGFCEHYASAFTFMMRAVGIPARLAVGYMGGEYNAEGDFYRIKQKDAHAWSEVWLAGKGFVRFDPTAYVNPERVEQGLNEQLNAERSALSGELFNYSKVFNAPLLKQFKQQFEKIDYQWSKWVVGFNAQKQFNMLASLFGDVQQWKSTALIFVAFVFTIVVIWLFNGRKRFTKKMTDEHALYQKALELVKTQGLDKPPAMSVLAFAQVVAHNNKAMAKPFLAFSQAFNALCYSPLTAQQKKKMYSVMQLKYKQCKLALKQ